jgi:malate dehydrogenase (oxaloacetate-decarboxylating)
MAKMPYDSTVQKRPSSTFILMISQRPSPSYSLTLRIEYPNKVGMLGRVTSVIGEQGGDIGAIDIVQTSSGLTRRSITRDITFAAIDYAHSQQIIGAVRGIDDIDVVSVSDRTFLSHLGGKLEIHGRVPVKTRDDLSRVYVPGVTRIAETIVENPDDVYNLSIKRNCVAIVSDGSELLGLGAAGPHAALPVMEAKALLFQEFAGVDAFPLCLDVASVDEFVAAVKAASPAFGAIHLEDIAAPCCFEVEEKLAKTLDIPVLHNDQHGTAIVMLAALINALRIVTKATAGLKVVVHGAGAAGLATTQLLQQWGVHDIIVCADGSTLHAGRVEEFADHPVAAAVSRNTNPRQVCGDLRAALQGADVFIGFGRQTILTADDLRTMSADPIVFMMAYPQPEVDLNEAMEVARVFASGRSDFPNQINNMLCFPGFFRGLLDARASQVDVTMKIAAAQAIADIIGRDEIHEDYLVPSVFDRRVAKAVAQAVVHAAQTQGLARRNAKSPLR